MPTITAERFSDGTSLLRNLYLFAGVRGDFTLRTRRIPDTVEVELLRTLDRWGISPLPWGPCDSGADLIKPGRDVVRGWAHVDLHRSDYAEIRADIPVSGLLRTVWDGLELFGEIMLTGVDTIVPLVCAGEDLWTRVAGALLRTDDRAGPERPRAVITAEIAPGLHGAIASSKTAILETLAELIDIRSIPHHVERIENSDTSHPFESRDAHPISVEALALTWTIDDAAWLAEAMAAACVRAGVDQDVLISVRVDRPSSRDVA